MKTSGARWVEVELAAKPDGFVVRRSARSYVLADLLSGVRPRNRPAEIPTGPAQGGEAW